MKKLFAIVLTAVLTLTFSISSFAAAGSPESMDDILNYDQTITNADLLASTTEDAADADSTKAFKGIFKDKFDELNGYRQECSALWSNIKTTNQSIKAAWTGFKSTLEDMTKEEAKQALDALKSEVAPIREQVKAIHSDIQSLRTLKKVEWEKFHAAVQERNEAAASAALDNIISLKKQIIEKQKILIDLKQQILNSIG